MPATSILGGISQEATQEELLGHMTLLLAAILEKLPRTDAADRLFVSHAESNPTVSIAATQTLATVTTVGSVTTVGNQTNLGGRDASHAAYALANMGTAHIYNNVLVS